SSHHYTDSVSRTLRGTGRYLLIYVLLVAGMALMFIRLPASFLPEEDQGVLLTMVQLPAGSTQEQTQDVLERVNDYFNTDEKELVKSVFTVSGFGFGGQGQNMGLV
ncbi:multidrug efflux RND transporter permease subunit, partial [Escherichia coli]|nr:multidrug efflux RND transporter permease subunit [Escherichia coli]